MPGGGPYIVYKQVDAGFTDIFSTSNQSTNFRAAAIVSGSGGYSHEAAAQEVFLQREHAENLGTLAAAEGSPYTATGLYLLEEDYLRASRSFAEAVAEVLLLRYSTLKSTNPTRALKMLPTVQRSEAVVGGFYLTEAAQFGLAGDEETAEAVAKATLFRMLLSAVGSGKLKLGAKQGPQVPRSVAPKNVANVIQDHHAIPWNNTTFNHQAHPLVKQARANLETHGTNIKPLKGHIGRHSTSYHQEIRRRMDEGFKRVVGKGKDAAEAELESVLDGIWKDIGSGKLKPYDHKDVILP